MRERESLRMVSSRIFDKTSHGLGFPFSDFRAMIMRVSETDRQTSTDAPIKVQGRC
jgi:hypothetical protein